MEAVIRCESLSKNYGSYLALRGVSMSVAKGEFISVMGPSGCGKSTMLNILGLLDKPTSGKYFLSGQDVSALNDEERTRLRRDKIGFIFQSFNLLPRMSLLENAALPMEYAGRSRPESRERAAALLKRVGLPGAQHLKTPLELSGGQRQRVGIARALANEPSVLLADEPTGNLDSKTGEEILKLFMELHQQGVTLVLVTHDLAIAKRTQRIVELRDGMVV